MRWPSAVLRLVRWENTLISAAGVLIGAWWVGGNPLSRPALLLAAAAMFLAAVANSYNDIVDLEIDRIAHPERPLPSGALSLKTARAIHVASIVLAVACSVAVTPGIGMSSLVIIVVMIVYSRLLKKQGLPGNVTVAVLASLPFLYGAWSAGRPLASLPLIALAVPLHLAREIAKDIEDAAGDAISRRTLPLAFGERAARNALFVALGAFLGGLAWFARGQIQFGLAVLPAVAFVLFAAHHVAQGRRGAPRYFKMAMLCAMAALPFA
jgi:geranylgeranylglycerol-phosphate geranylgeranyltransferase